MAAAIADPHDNKPMRLPTFPNLERTAVAGTFATATIPVSSTVAGFAVRSATYPLWLQKFPNATNTNAAGAVVAQVITPTFTTNVPAITFDSTEWLNTVTVSNTFDDTARVLGADAESVYLYMPTGVYFSVTITASAGTFNSLGITIEVFDGTQNYVRNWENSPGSASYTLTDNTFGGGFWIRPLALSARCSTACSIALDFGWTTGNSMSVPTGSFVGTPLFPISSPPEFAVFPALYQNVRQNACGVLFKNVTAVLEKEGTVRATRIPLDSFGALAAAQRLWTAGWILSPPFLTSNPVETYFGALENGLYTFTLPDSSSSVIRNCLTNWGSVTSNPTLYPVFRLDGFDYVNCFLFTDIDAARPTQLAVEVDSHVEFRTNSTLFTLGFSTISLEEYHRAQMAVTTMGAFFENPLHLATIAALARSAAAKYGPKLIGMAAPHLARAGQKLLSYTSQKLGAMNQKNPGNPTPSRKGVVVPKKKVKAVGKGKKK